MKTSKNISLFKITFVILINLFISSIFLKVISFLYLFIDFKLKTILIVLIFFLLILTNNINIDLIKYGYVENINNNYIVIDKLLYKEKVYTNQEYKIGQIVKTKNEISIKDKIDLKYNYRFYSNDDPLIVKTNTCRTILYEFFDNLNLDVKNYVKNIVFNSYSFDDDILYLGYGFGFYYLLLMTKKKNSILCLSLLIIYVVFIKVDIKFYLLIIDMILDKKEIYGLNKLSVKFIFISLINKYLIFNNSILLSLIFAYLYLNGFNDKSVLMLVQSLFFNEIQLGTSILYKYFVYTRITLFCISIIVLIFPCFSNAYLSIINITAYILNLISISIRGKISYIGILLYLILIRLKCFKSTISKCLIIFILLIPCINNPIKHLNFIDVGQGDCTLIRDNFGKYNVLIDTGSKYNYAKLKKELFKEGIYTIDYLIISHEDEDHSGNINNLKKDFKIKEVVQKGKDIKLGNIKLDYINLGNFNNPNDNSLVYLLEMDERKTLFTGDISKKVENIIFNKLDIKNIDILKIGHHGSNTSSSSYFVGTLNPEYVTILTNGKYNHPHVDTLNVLNSYKLDYLITKYEGSIKFYITNFIDICVTNKRVEWF